MKLLTSIAQFIRALLKSRHDLVLEDMAVVCQNLVRRAVLELTATVGHPMAACQLDSKCGNLPGYESYILPRSDDSRAAQIEARSCP